MYNSVIEVMREALRLLEEKDALKEVKLATLFIQRKSLLIFIKVLKHSILSMGLCPNL